MFCCSWINCADICDNEEEAGTQSLLLEEDNGDDDEKDGTLSPILPEGFFSFTNEEFEKIMTAYMFYQELAYSNRRLGEVDIRRFMDELDENDETCHNEILNGNDWRKDHTCLEILCLCILVEQIFENPLNSINNSLKTCDFSGCVIEDRHVKEQIQNFTRDLGHDPIEFDNPSIRYKIYDDICIRGVRKTRELAHFLIPYHEIENIFDDECKTRVRLLKVLQWWDESAIKPDRKWSTLKSLLLFLKLKGLVVWILKKAEYQTIMKNTEKSETGYKEEPLEMSSKENMSCNMVEHDLLSSSLWKKIDSNVNESVVTELNLNNFDSEMVHNVVTSVIPEQCPKKYAILETCLQFQNAPEDILGNPASKSFEHLQILVLSMVRQVFHQNFQKVINVKCFGMSTSPITLFFGVCKDTEEELSDSEKQELCTILNCMDQSFLPYNGFFKSINSNTLPSGALKATVNYVVTTFDPQLKETLRNKSHDIQHKAKTQIDQEIERFSENPERLNMIDINTWQAKDFVVDEDDYYEDHWQTPNAHWEAKHYDFEDVLQLLNDDKIEELKRLLKCQPDVIHLKSSCEETLIYKASELGEYDSLRLVLETNTDSINTCAKYYNPLTIASIGGHNLCVGLLLQHHADVNAKDIDGATALMCASIHGHKLCVELLLKHNADVNIKDEDGETALICASINGHASCVELLLQYNVDINIKDEDGETALMCASMHGQESCVELLLEQNADTDIKNKYGKTALMCASMNGHKSCVELLQHCVHINIQDEDGETALMYASLKGHKSCVELLLKHNADINIKDEEGETALISASVQGHKSCVELLLKHNADVNVQDKDGYTALISASRYGHTSCVELLLQYHADINIKNKDGETAINLAVNNQIKQTLTTSKQ